MTAGQDYDVAILGGGLAGLSLAIQLKNASAGASILVAERQSHPLPEAEHKVGESTVERGAQYFRKVIGMEEHMTEAELPQLGLRFFFPAGDNSEITRRVEVGPTEWPKVPSFQLDRGRFENALGQKARGLGIHFLDFCKVERVELGQERHAVTLQRDEEEFNVHARWIVDASGRTAILKRQLGLAKNNDHNNNAAWFRIGNWIKVDDWSDDPDWQARVPSGERWLSTNHLMGRGYWVWLIPLASGATSVGIVADPALHPFQEFNTFERAMAWLHRHEPQCAQIIGEQRPFLRDFRVLKHYSHSCNQVFSPLRWCLTGEAATFLDPFYSLGSDFIAVANSMITALITADLQGAERETMAAMAGAYNQIYFARFEHFLHLYQGQYPLWGSAKIMTAKTVWEYAVYWSAFALLDIQGKVADLQFLGSVLPDLNRLERVHARMQALFPRWDALDRAEYKAAFADHVAIPFVGDLQAALEDKLTDEELRTRIAQNVDDCEALAIEIFREAAQLVAPDLKGRPINPQAISLEPERWEEDGLFSSADALRATSYPHMAEDLTAIWFDHAGVA